MRSTTAGVKARAKAIQPCGWPVPVLSKIGRTTNSAGPRARCTMPRTLSADAVELARGDALLDRREQIGIGRNLVFLDRGRGSMASDSARLEIAVEHQDGVDVEAHQRAGVERIGEVVGPVAARELGGLVPDRVVADRGVQVVEFGLEAALELVALHVHVARLDVGDVDQPAALRPAVENDENDGDHRADHGQRRLPDSGFWFPELIVAGHNVNCVTWPFGPLQQCATHRDAPQ